MSEVSEEKISMNLKLLTFAMAVIISVFGYFITRTLNSIDQNIVDLRIELAKKNEVLGNHESRISVIEEWKRSNQIKLP